MQDSKVTIIIPVYNVRAYLTRCIESIIQQSYKNLEIIIVDDGSTDGSQIICDEFGRKDKRIQVLHKANGGLSDARNVGYSEASGEYIFFLDSDDWLKPNAIEILYNTLITYDADIVVANYYYQYDTECISTNKIDQTKEFNKKEAMEVLLKNDLIKNFAWGKLYKRELLEKYKFPVGKLFEDVYWTHLIFDQAQKVVVVKEELVYYYQRNTSISYKFDIKKIHIVEGYLQRRKFIEKEYPDLLHLVDETIISLIINLYIESIRHYKIGLYSEFKSELMKICFELQEKINSDPLLDKRLINEFNDFCKSPWIHFVKKCIHKVRKRI